ncbi:unnamed protein product [Symbiodinium sp. KB8]|nr:unnamed protein product [Symbiodinium sp. KB8]
MRQEALCNAFFMQRREERPEEGQLERDPVPPQRLGISTAVVRHICERSGKLDRGDKLCFGASVISSKPRCAMAATAESRSYGRSMAKAMAHFKDSNFSGFCEALAVGSLQDASISVTLAQPEEPDCPLVGVSKGFQLLTGYARDEVLGRNCRFLNRGCVVPKEERLRLRAALSRGLSRRAPKAPRGAASAASFAGLLQNRRKNGEAFLNYLCIKTLRVGSLFYFLGFQVDMTHRSDSEHVQNLVQLEMDAIVSTILYAQEDVLSRLQVVEDFDQKAWLLRKEYDHANFASLEHDERMLTKNTFLEVQADEDERPLRRSVSDSIFEEGSNTSEEAFTKTLKILKDQADWLHEKATVKDEPKLEEKTENTKLPSVGSQFHPDRCTPCSFHCYSLRGCLHGEACEFCHLEHLRRPKPKKRGRKKPEEVSAGGSEGREVITQLRLDLVLCIRRPVSSMPVVEDGADGASRTQSVQDQVQGAMAVMQDNMRAMAERDSQLNQLEARTNDLQGASKAFSSGAKRLQRHYQWQRYKFYFAIGAVVVLVVALILLPSQYKVPFFAVSAVLLGALALIQAALGSTREPPEPEDAQVELGESLTRDGRDGMDQQARYPQLPLWSEEALQAVMQAWAPRTPQGPCIGPQGHCPPGHIPITAGLKQGMPRIPVVPAPAAWAGGALRSQMAQLPKAAAPGVGPACPFCGNIYAQDARFCRKCGQPRAEVKPSVPPVPGFLASSCGQGFQAGQREVGLRRFPSAPNVQARGLSFTPSPVSAAAGSNWREQVVREASAPAPQASACPFLGAMLPLPAVPQVKEIVEVASTAATTQPEDSMKQFQVVIREKPVSQQVEKVVEVPQVSVSDSTIEVPVSLVQEKVVEVPEVQYVELLKQVPKVQYQERLLQVEKLVAEGRTLEVEVPVEVQQERLVEVSQAQPLEICREVAKVQRQSLAKHFAKPVVQWKESLREVPQTTIREQIQEVPTARIVELLREVPKPEIQKVEKPVEVPSIQLTERIVEVPSVELRETASEVAARVEVREVVRQVPKVEVQFVEKKIPKPVIQYVEKTVEVPHVVYEERIVEVPEIEVKELIRQVPVPVIQYVEKRVPKCSVRLLEKLQEVPQAFQEERAVEVQQAVGVDLEVHVPKVSYTEVEKEVAAVTLQPREKVVEVPVILREERLVEVPKVQAVPVVTQHLRPAVEFVEKPVAVAEISLEERQVQAKPTVLIEEELLEIPQQQLVEVTRQELQPVLEEVVKEVPKYRVEYLEKVVEVQSQVLPQDGDGAAEAAASKATASFERCQLCRHHHEAVTENPTQSINPAQSSTTADMLPYP